MRISEVATETGLSVHTIRYYEKLGLSRSVARGSDGKRKFSSEDLQWLVLLASLRETGMPMRKMRRFAKLYQQGDATVSDRKQMLLDHSEQLKERKLVLKKCSDLLAYKLAKYEEIIGEAE